MIAIQTANDTQSLDSNRALGASRGSLPAHAQTTTINNSATAHAFSSPVTDGGGAESARRRGSSSDNQTTNYKPPPTDAAPYNPAQPHILPEDIIESNLIDALLDGSFDLPQLCAHFKLAPTELLEYLESPQTKQLLETLAKIATIRANMIASQARVAATHRLSELARHGHITDSPREARANETARKAAAQLLRAPSQVRRISEPTGGIALRAVPLEVCQISEPTSSARRISNPTVQHIQQRTTIPSPVSRRTNPGKTSHQSKSEPRRPRRGRACAFVERTTQRAIPPKSPRSRLGFFSFNLVSRGTPGQTLKKSRPFGRLECVIRSIRAISADDVSQPVHQDR